MAIRMPKPDRKEQSLFQVKNIRKQAVAHDAYVTEIPSIYGGQMPSFEDKPPPSPEEEIERLEEHQKKGDELWKHLKIKKSSVNIIVGRNKVSSLVEDLREKLKGMKTMMGDMDNRKDQLAAQTLELRDRDSTLKTTATEAPIVRPEGEAGKEFVEPELPEPAWLDTERSHLFVYNPVTIQDRYLPCIGLRAIKTFRGAAVEVLGDPRNTDHMADVKRRLRKDQQLARGDQYSPPRSPEPSSPHGSTFSAFSIGSDSATRRKRNMPAKKKAQSFDKDLMDSIHPSGAQTAREPIEPRPLSQGKLERLQTRRKLWKESSDLSSRNLLK